MFIRVSVSGFFFFKQKTAYEMRISDWSSDVCSSDLSGAGKEGMDELFEQTRAVFVGDPKENRKSTKQIAFNVIPHIDVFLGPDSGLDGYTKEEWKMTDEKQKILRSEEQTSELQSLMRISYDVLCLKKNKNTNRQL